MIADRTPANAELRPECGVIKAEAYRSTTPPPQHRQICQRPRWRLKDGFAQLPNTTSRVAEVASNLFKMSELKNFDRMFRLDGKVALVTGGTFFSRFLSVRCEGPY